MEEHGLLIAILAGVLAVIGFATYFTYRKERARREALGQIAAQLGLDFSADGDETLQSDLQQFHLLSRGRSRRLRNLMQGTYGGRPVAVFDYRYTTGGSRSNHTISQTVVCLELSGTSLPSFFLRPKNVWHRIRARLGHGSIDFPNHPTFSAEYVLRGDDEQAIRNTFTPSVLSFYTGRDRMNTESNGRRLLYYRQSHRVRPEEIRSWIEAAVDLLTRLNPRSSRGTVFGR